MGGCGRKDSSRPVWLGGRRENRAQHGWGADGRLRPGRPDRWRILGAGAPRRPRGVADGHPRARALAPGRRHRARRPRREPGGARRLDARAARQLPAPDAGAVRGGARHGADDLRRGRARRQRARPAPRAAARDRPERPAPRHRRGGRPPHRRRLHGPGTALGAAIAVRLARRAAPERARAHVGGAGAPRRWPRARALGRRRRPRAPRALQDRLRGLPRQEHAQPRGRRAVRRAAPRSRARSAPARRAPPRSCPRSTAARLRASPSRCRSSAPRAARRARS